MLECSGKLHRGKTRHVESRCELASTVVYGIMIIVGFIESRYNKTFFCHPARIALQALQDKEEKLEVIFNYH